MQFLPSPARGSLQIIMKNRLLKSALVLCMATTTALTVPAGLSVEAVRESGVTSIGEDAFCRGY